MSQNGHWGPRQGSYTFRSGRKAILRDGLPLSVITLTAMGEGEADIASGLSTWATGGQMDDPALASRIMRKILEVMFVEPRLVWDEADLPQDPDGVIAAVWLTEDEVDEVIAVAQEGLAAAARFQDKPAGDDGGSGGKGVGKPAQRTRRATAGKR